MKETEPVHNKVRIAIIVWGFSIHAKRRIEVFSEDSRFDVSVISNYPYIIQNTDVFLLPSGKRETAKKIRDVKKSKCEERNDEILFYSFIRKKILFVLKKIQSGLREISGSMMDIISMNEIIRKCNPSIVFLQTLLYPSYLFFFIPTKIPLMITFWNGDVIWWAKNTFLEMVLKKQIIQWGLQRAKAITVNSTMAFNACLSMGKDPSLIHLIRYPGVDIEKFKPRNKSTSRDKLHITSDFVILWPRGANYYNNYETLLCAVPELVNKYPTILIIMLQVIEGELSHAEIDAWISKNPEYQSNFLVMGVVSHESMPDYYNASDVMISLSSNDSLPNCMLEAMASKTPLIMGDIKQIREWVIDGENGYLIPVHDDAALIDRIIRIRENENGKIDFFTNKNRHLIEQEFDSRIINERIKELVITALLRSSDINLDPR